MLQTQDYKMKNYLQIHAIYWTYISIQIQGEYI